jgi:serine/threonine protein phosphatase PrpC
MSETTFTWAERTDVGRVREINQDSLHAQDGLFVVADGMGGHRGGEVASAVAIEAIVSGDEPPITIDELVERVRAAHQAVLDRAESDPDLAGMGTTLCAIGRLDGAERPGMLGLVNVGDSRIYRFGGTELRQVSEDHSLVGDLVRSGHLTPEEAASHPQRNIVTRALGIGGELLVDHWEIPAIPDDVYLLCSDGLVDEIGDRQIAAAMRRLAEPSELVDELVRLALEAGARDNVSVVVARVDQSADPAVTAPGSIAGPTTSSAPVRTSALGDTGSLVEKDSVYGSRVPLGSEADQSEPASDRPKARSGLGRTRALSALVLAALIVIGGIWVVASYARNNYFVGFENDQVVVYQGRPDGFLWFDPTFEEGAGLLREALTPALALEVGANPEFGSLADAQNYVVGLEVRVDDTESSSGGDDDSAG